MLFTALIPALRATAASTIGYTNGDTGKDYRFRVGSTEKQGVAIKLGPEKLAMLKGRTISAIEAVIGTRQTYDGTARLFIATTPDSETPLAEQKVKISIASRWQTYSLDKPYTITGDEGTLYIGYTLEIAKDYSPLQSDYGRGSVGVCYAYNEGEWTDVYNLNVGNVSVRAVIDEGPELADLMLKTLGYEGYHKLGEATVYGGQLHNFGTATVTSFDIELKVGDAEPSVTKYENRSIAPGATFDFTLPEYAATETGSLPVTVTVKNVNGGGDADMSDNSLTETMFFYPADMERCLLLEGFTGQDCSNCPTGHSYINSFLKSTEYDVVEVMHHIGYFPDIYSMAAEDSYLLFYGETSSTEAPLFMMNRSTIEALGTRPVLYPDLSNLNYAANYAANRQPYVSLKLESDYDEATREVKVNLMVYAHNDLPTEQNLLNVVLVQDSIRGYQSGMGQGYPHTRVFRGTLTGNPWGKTFSLSAGKSVTYTTTYTLPETIFSDYWENNDANRMAKGYSVDSVTIPTNPAQTYIVAYVGAYGGNNDKDGHEVYNCTEVKLGESHTQGGLTGIAAAPTVSRADVRIKANGRRITVEGCDTYYIYNVAGRSVAADSELERGIYIVRAMADGRQTTKKIVIR